MTTAPIAGYRRSVLARSLALALTIPFACGAAFAQEAADDEEEGSAETTQLDTVEVVGSRIKRAEIEGPSPVTVITAAQIEAEGFNTVYDALNTLTQTTGSFQNELFQNGFTPNAQVLNLRGLGPGRVLTLINGRRAADYPLPYNGQSNFVNLASVPTAAVERIELLAGGASAIYGSDAVAGVVNFILDNDFEGLKLEADTGITNYGDGFNYSISAAAGLAFADNRGRLLLSGEIAHRDGIFSTDDRAGFVTGQILSVDGGIR